MSQCLVCGSESVELFCRTEDRALPGTGPLWDVLRCRACGFGWTSPPLAESEIHSYYPPTYLGNTLKTLEEFLSGELAKSRSWRGETEKVALVEEYQRGGRLLDVGCGDGKFLWALDPSRWHRTGVELSQATVELVRARVPDVRLLAGDIYSRELDEGTFDVVTFWHALEHLPDPRRVIRRAHRLLAGGGRLFVSLPNLDSLQARVFRNHWYAFDDVPRHLYHYSRRSLHLLLAEAGFTNFRAIFFSRRVAFHSLKHSTRRWSATRLASTVPYYLVKPMLPLLQVLEQLTGCYSILTVVARKPGK